MCFMSSGALPSVRLLSRQLRGFMTAIKTSGFHSGLYAMLLNAIIAVAGSLILKRRA
jgi:hypothetical protein